MVKYSFSNFSHVIFEYTLNIASLRLCTYTGRNEYKYKFGLVERGLQIVQGR